MVLMEEELRQILADTAKLSQEGSAVKDVTALLSKQQESLRKLNGLVDARKKRAEEDEKNKQKNQRLQKQLEEQHANAQAEDVPDIDEPAEQGPQDDDPEPGTVESLSMRMEQLLSTQQLIAYAGEGREVLELLFTELCHGEHPFPAYAQLASYFKGTAPGASGGQPDWVPQLDDFYNATQRLGYKPPATGSRKRTAAGGAAAAGPSDAGAAGPGSGGCRVCNLQCLLRLLADLTKLHQQGRVSLGYNQQAQATGKQLIIALLRMDLDPELTAVLHADIAPALEGLLIPWEDVVWGRIREDVAAFAAQAGPSCRSALRAVMGLPGYGARKRSLQQSAALLLIKQTLGKEGTSKGSSRRQSGVDLHEMLELLGQEGSQREAKAIITALTAPGGKKPDLWKLQTVLHCMHIIVWEAAYGVEPNAEEDAIANADKLVHWLMTFFKSMEQCLKGRSIGEMNTKLFIADAALVYDSGCKPADDA